MSSLEFGQENESKIKALLKNGYPSHLVNKIINEFKHSNNITHQNKEKKYFEFPYINCDIAGDFELVFCPINKVESVFTTFKGKAPKLQQSNEVYKID